MATPVYLVRGDDPVLLNTAVRDLVRELVGNEESSLMVEELSSDDYEAARVADAAQTPPFLTTSRVVVARNASRFNADDLGPIVAYLANPLDTTSLVIEWPTGVVPKKLADAIKACGGQTLATAVPTRKDEKATWLDEHWRSAPVHLEGPARSALLATLADDLGRLPAILETLAGAYGQQARITLEDITPFLGEQGTVPPWDLTDAIDSGRTADAINNLRRMMNAGGKHPLQILATLHGHYGRMLKLDNPNVRNEQQAADALNLKGSTFPAKKAFNQMRALGRPGLNKAIELLARADLDVRGATDWEPETVVEVLVARLSRLGPARPVRH